MRKSKFTVSHVCFDNEKSKFGSMAKEGRFKDNHFNEILHKTPFCTRVRELKNNYLHSASGLFHNFDSRYDVLEKDDPTIKKIDPTQVRIFAEYNEINLGQIIVTIEHCSHCYQHQAYTRHQETQYIMRAQSLRDMIVGKYPYIKVLLKPIKEMVQVYKNPLKVRLKTKKLTHEDLNIDKYRPELRLGAFEVQICILKNQEKHINILFSKLKSHTWPSSSYLLDKISDYVPKTNLTVRLLFNDEGSEVLPKNNIFVRIYADISKEEEIRRQFNDIICEQTNLSNSVNNSRPMIISRPMTAKNFNNKSMGRSILETSTSNIISSRTTIIQKINSGKNTFRPMSASTKSAHPKSINLEKKSRILIKSEDEIPPAKTDTEGKATFINIPIQNYIIEIKPSKDFQGAMRKYPISNDITFKSHYIVNVEVHNQKQANVSVKVCEDNDSGKILSKCNVFMTLKGKLKTEGQAFNYPLRFNLLNQTYEGTIVPGDYLLVVINGGYTEYYEDIVFDACNVPLFQVNLENSINKDYILCAKDINSGNRVAQAQISISNPGCQLPLEEITNENGEYKIEIEKFGIYKLGASLRNYVPYSRSLTINRSSPEAMLVPMFPILKNQNESNIIRIVLGSDQIINGVNLRINIPQYGKSSDQLIEENILKIEKNDICTIAILKKIQCGEDQWCRIFVEVDEMEKLFKNHKYDKQFLNPIQSLNYFVGIIFFNEFKYFISAPSFIGGKYWDVGILNIKNNDFILTNSWVPFLPSRKELLHEYIQIFNQIIDRSKNQISAMFRFDLNSWALPGDNYMLPETFDCVIRGLNIEVNPDKDRNRFYTHFRNSVCDVFGNFSFSSLYNSIRNRMNFLIDMAHFIEPSPDASLEKKKVKLICQNEEDSEKIIQKSLAESPIQEIKKDFLKDLKGDSNNLIYQNKSSNPFPLNTKEVSKQKEGISIKEDSKILQNSEEYLFSNEDEKE